MESRAQYLGGCIFSCSEEIIYSFLNFLFDILESINLVHVSQFGNNDLVSHYVFTSQKASHSVPYMGFFGNLQLLYPIWSYRE